MIQQFPWEMQENQEESAQVHQSLWGFWGSLQGHVLFTTSSRKVVDTLLGWMGWVELPRGASCFLAATPTSSSQSLQVLVSSSLHRPPSLISCHFSPDPPLRICRVTQSKAFVVAFYLRCRTLSPAPFPANHFGEVLMTVPCDLTSPLGLALTFVLYTGVSQSKQEHLLYLESFLPIFMIQFFNKKNRSSRIVHIHIPIN